MQKPEHVEDALEWLKDAVREWGSVEQRASAQALLDELERLRSVEQSIAEELERLRSVEHSLADEQQQRVNELAELLGVQPGPRGAVTWSDLVDHARQRAR